MYTGSNSSSVSPSSTAWYSNDNELGAGTYPKSPLQTNPSLLSYGFRLYIGPEPTLGTKAKPAISCKAILDAKQSLGDGVYWLDPDGPGGTESFQAYCDMTTDGGGWTMLLSATATGTYWGNNSPNWKKVGLSKAAVGYEDKESHSLAFGRLKTQTIRLCYQSAAKCFNFDHAMNLTLQEFFTSGKRFTAYSYKTVGVSDTGQASVLSGYSSALGVALGSGDYFGGDNLYCDWLAT